MNSPDYPPALAQAISSTNTDALITERDAADFLGVTARALQKWRATGTGPRYVRISGRCVRYRRCDLNQWIAARLKSSTAEA